ncbi:Hypothetical Protein FCC1311_049762 [Hondaea fermentalgiana]|uniref:Uncharacterized protein n=1 Tax=Hondaea fermentalgiana TaxID=2315210 RepID=A0A2R5GDW3_9STRA|nr:Hypothetical Protein FCC1311_049762 [Hondaea fermentalgiana]|eukprot:GBG28755.1 Hypothetical Protein FCC1311_049762 [Hondaea fermentalgiana]
MVAMMDRSRERADAASAKLRDAQMEHATLASKIERLEQERDFLSKKGLFTESLADAQNGAADISGTGLAEMSEVAVRMMLPLVDRELASTKKMAETVRSRFASLQNELENCREELNLFGAATRSRTLAYPVQTPASWSLGKVNPQDPMQLQSLRFERPYEVLQLALPGFMATLLDRRESIAESLGAWCSGTSPWAKQGEGEHFRLPIPLLNIAGGSGIGKSRFLEALAAPVQAIDRAWHMQPEHVQKPLMDGQLKWAALQDLAAGDADHGRFIARFRRATGVAVSFRGEYSRDADPEAAPEDALCTRVLHSYFGQGSPFTEFLGQIYTDSLPSLAGAIRIIKSDIAARRPAGEDGATPTIILCVDDILDGAKMQQDALDVMVLAIAEACEQGPTLLPAVACSSQHMLDVAVARSTWATEEILLAPLSRETVAKAVELYHEEKPWQAPRWMHDDGAMEVFAACAGVPKLMSIVAPRLKPHMGSMLDHIKALMTTSRLQREIEDSPLYNVHSPDASLALASALSARKRPFATEEATLRLLRQGLLTGSFDDPFLAPIVPYIWTQLFGLKEPPLGFARLLASFDQVVNVSSEGRAAEEILKKGPPSTKRSMGALIMYLNAASQTSRGLPTSLSDLVLGEDVVPYSAPVETNDGYQAFRTPVRLGLDGLTVVEDFDVPTDAAWEPEPMHAYVLRYASDLQNHVNMLVALPESLGAEDEEAAAADRKNASASSSCVILGVSIRPEVTADPTPRSLARSAYALLNPKGVFFKWAREERFVYCQMRPRANCPGDLQGMYESHKSLMQSAIDPANEFHKLAENDGNTDVWRTPSVVLSFLRSSLLVDERDYVGLFSDTVFAEYGAMDDPSSRVEEISRKGTLFSKLSGEGESGRNARAKGFESAALWACSGQ